MTEGVSVWVAVPLGASYLAGVLIAAGPENTLNEWSGRSGPAPPDTPMMGAVRRSWPRVLGIRSPTSSKCYSVLGIRIAKEAGTW